MYLFEFDSTHQISDAIVATTQQLQQELDAGQLGDWDVEKLLRYYRDYDVILDREDLYNMIKVPPMNNLISNIQGDKVVWKGQEPEPNAEPPNPEDQKKTVAKMAQRAMN